jgi:hypothetical protein
MAVNVTKADSAVAVFLRTAQSAKFRVNHRTISKRQGDQEIIPFRDLIIPLSAARQDVQPARLQGRVVTLRVPARTTPSSGVSLSSFGAVQLAFGPFGAQSKGWSLGR